MLTELKSLFPAATRRKHPVIASSVDMNHLGERHSLKKTLPSIPASTGADPMATIVPIATPVSLTAEKKAN